MLEKKNGGVMLPYLDVGNRKVLTKIALGTDSVCLKRALNGFGSLLILWILYLGGVLTARNFELAPDYDALSYVTYALMLKEFLFDGASYKAVISAQGLSLLPLPFTNTLDVLILAGLWPFLDFHASIFLVHSAYLLFFFYIFRKTLEPAYALLLFNVCVGYGLFFSQFVHFISELKVGLGYVAIILLLFVADAERVRWQIFAVSALLVFLRVFNGAFVLAFAFVYFAVNFRKGDFKELLLTLGALLAPVVIYLIILPDNLWDFLDYYKKGGQNLHVWVAMSGIHNKWELLSYYWNMAMKQYNPVFVVLFVGGSVLSAVGLVYGAPDRQIKPASVLGFWGAVLVMSVALVAPAVSNVHLVYWFYVTCGLIAIVLLRWVNPRFVGALSIIVSICVVCFLWIVFQQQLRVTDSRRQISEVSRELSREIAKIENPVVFTNFHGVGPLDTAGMQLYVGRSIGYARRINLTGRLEGVGEDELRTLLSRSNVMILAHDNYFWPNYVAWNRYVANVYGLAVDIAPALGFRRVASYLYDKNPRLPFDVWVKPSARAGVSGDGWLESEVNIGISDTTEAILEGFLLDFDIQVHDPGQPEFAPPIEFALLDQASHKISSGVISAYGKSSLCMNFSGKPGTYKLVSDKKFSTNADKRNLVAQLRSLSIRRGRCDDRG
jgi:hypothetical protein